MLSLLFLLGLITKESNQDYVNHEYNGLISPEQIITSNSNIKQISGCRFINIESPQKNYYIRINSNPVDIFDNVFENNVENNNYPAIFWIENNQNEIKIKNCTFTKIVGKSSADGSILNSDSTTLIIFEECKFNNCGIGSTKALVDFKSIKDGAGTCRFTSCSFYYDKSEQSCQVIVALSSGITFESCEFTRCKSNTIHLNVQPTTSATTTGNFEFIDNKIYEMRSQFIRGNNVQGKINISSNLFRDIRLSGSYFIYIEHDQQFIELNNNTFSTFVVDGNDNINFGGISTCLKCTTSSHYKISFFQNNFYDIKNLCSSSPYNYGGAIQIGFSNEFENIELNISKCEFKRNKTPKHGGALAIQTYSSIYIAESTFELNEADAAGTISKLLSTKHEGRGGAIFISSLKTDTNSMGQITIENCLFNKNAAFDGFSIYFEGEELETVPTIASNKFYNNYNVNDSPNDGGCVASEILNVDKISVEEQNEFANYELGRGTEKFIYVSNSGEKLPDQTSAPMPTPEPTKTPIPGSNANFIDKSFEGAFSYQQAVTSNSNIKQISGCRFINIESPQKNYYIRINSNPVDIFDNVFENNVENNNYPAIFWIENNQNEIKIKNCTFTKIVGKSSADGSILNSDSTTLIIFEECKFNNCGIGSTKALVDFKSIKDGAGTCRFTSCSFYYDKSEQSCQIIVALSSGITFESCEFTRCKSNTIHLNVQPTTSATTTGNFEFINNKIYEMRSQFIRGNNVQGKINISSNLFRDIRLSGSYFIYIEHDQQFIELNNNTFSTFVVDGNDNINFGGISTCLKCTNNQLSSRCSMTYDHCNFCDIVNSCSMSNGGAIQFGFSSDFNQNDLILSNCHFRYNQAGKNGGAVAIQTFGSVTIQSCLFEDNKANGNHESSIELLADKEGRGGALFISIGNATDHAERLVIKQCTFKRNVAYDAYSIYIEGENSDAVFEITGNEFFDNYNLPNAQSSGACFASEVTCIAKDEIESENIFSNKYEGSDSKRFYHVDQFGNPLPDPSPLPTPVPTPFSAFIDKEYSGPFSYEQAISSNLLFEQISGCRFINIESPQKNYYIRINSNPVDIFDNVFENNVENNNYPAIFWIENNQNEIKIKNCTFTKIVGKSSADGSILNSDSTTLIIFEECKFNNCGIGSTKALVDFKSIKDGAGTCRFTSCSFYYDKSEQSCQVIVALSSGITFESCEFTRCKSNTIHLNVQPTTSATTTGNFEFIDNKIYEMRSQFIRGNNVQGKINISSNLFRDIRLSGSYFIYIEHDQQFIELNNNTFSTFVVDGNDNINFGGISTCLKCTTSSHYKISFFQNNFYDINNLYSSSPYNYGGAIQIGFSNEFENIELNISKCEFKRNKTPKHGGALAIQTYSSIYIAESTFELNEADAAGTISKLLSTKHEGRGGAIFISSGSSQSYMTSVTIDHCKFEKNSAYDAYAIYIEGDMPDTEFSITNNQFSENYNNDGSPPTGGCIVSEVLLLEKDNIIKSNNFSNIELGTESEKFVYAYQSGDHLPKQSTKPFVPSSFFSDSKQFSYSAFFSESSDFSHSSLFSNSKQFSYSDIFLNSKEFSYSDIFSNSKEFSYSDIFLNSKEFSYSDIFSNSKEFSYSDIFLNSKEFSRSEFFTETNYFSNADYETSTDFDSSSEESFNSDYFSTEITEFDESNSRDISSFEESLQQATSDDVSLPADFQQTNSLFSEDESNQQTSFYEVLQSNDESKHIKSSQPFLSSSDSLEVHTLNYAQSNSFTTTANIDQKEADSMMSSAHKNRNTMLIVGIAVGIVVLIALAIIAVIFIIKKKPRNEAVPSIENSFEVNSDLYPIVSNENTNPLYDEDTNPSRDPFFNDFNEEE